MANGCMKPNENIYFRCRKEAALCDGRLSSREGASELLGISVSSLSDYELGNTKVVPVDKVNLMADLYRAPQLRTHYCKNECPIGKYIPVETELRGIETVVIRIIHLLDEDKLQEIKRQLLAVASDGKGSLTIFGTGEDVGAFSAEIHDCKIMASVETGTFSISMRDDCGIMLAVRIDEAVEVLAAALEIARDIVKSSEKSEQAEKTEEDKADE